MCATNLNRTSLRDGWAVGSYGLEGLENRPLAHDLPIAERVRSSQTAASISTQPPLSFHPPAHRCARRGTQLRVPGTSVAVLRFVNLSGDPEQDYFADGIVEDIITGLSRIGGVFVIASKSSFVFDRDSPDFARIGRELSCRYLVRGSVRKADKRIRITARLLEAETGVSIGAERYDRRLDDIFEVQDAVAMSLIGASSRTCARQRSAE